MKIKRTARRLQIFSSATLATVSSLESRRLMSGGQADDGFSGDGLNAVDLGFGTVIGGGSSFANAVAVQSDGKYVAVGHGSSTLGNVAKAARFNSNGGLDSTFGTGGSTSVELSTSALATSTAAAVSIQADGKIIVGGTSSNVAVPSDFSIARLNANGTTDSSWGAGGFRVVDFGGSESLSAIAMQSDGKVVAVGNFGGDVAVVRLTTTGAPDSTFSGDGKLTINFGAAETAADVAIQTDGSIVIAANTNSGGDGDFAVARILPNGTLDNTFDGDGMRTVDFGLDETCTAVELGIGGAIYLGGSGSAGAGAADYALARLTSAGALSTLFNTDGIALFDLGGAEAISTMALRPDQSLIIGGNGDFAQVTQFGNLDQTWGNGGSLVGTSEVFLDNLADMQLTPDGRVIAVGSEGSKFAIGRLTGVLETTFDDDGFAGADAAGGLNFELGQATAVLPDGRIYVGGSVGAIGDTDMFVMRYNPDGSLDTTFSADGKLTIERGGIDILTDIALQSDGKLVIAGYTDASGSDVVVVQRVNTNGTFDNTFAAAGVFSFEFSAGATVEDRASGVAIDPISQKIYVAGDLVTATSSDMAVARINTNGTLDTTFSSDGVLPSSFGGAESSADIALQADGKIVLAGTSVGVSPNTDNEFAVARITTTGVFDTTFDTDGKRLIDLGTNTDDECAAIAIDHAGRIVMVGNSGSSTGMVRLLESGANDNAFTGDGVQLISATPSQQHFNAIAVQADNRIVLAGQRVTDAGTFAVVQRFSSGGAVDSTFGGDGTHMFSLGEQTTLNAISLTRSIVVAGTAGGLSTVAIINAGADLVADSGEFLFDSAPHRLTFEFNQDVSASLSGSDFTISRLDDNLAITPSQYSLSYTSATDTATISFTNVFGGTVLADGNYRAVLSGMGVVGANGLTLSGDREFDFFIYRGDANHDRIVNISDFAALAANFNQPGTFSQGNFDYSALVDISDFALLASRFNTSLPFPADLPRTAAPASRAMFSNLRIQEPAMDDVLSEIVA